MKRALKKVSAVLILLVAVTLTLVCAPVKDVQAISAPTGLTIDIDGDNYTVSWKEVSGADSYNIYRAESRYATYEKVANVTETTYTETKDTSGYYMVTSVSGSSESAKSSPISEEIKLFGDGVYFFETTDDVTTINSIFKDIYKTQERNQFGSERYAYFFQPGTYSTKVVVDTGFYTQVAGLGISPTDTVIGNVNAKAEWMVSYKPNGDANFNATCNFWRAAENLTLNITNDTTTTPGKKESIWAVSQATSYRRMNVKGSLHIQHYGGYASGGYLADSKIDGSVFAWSQQQWLTRNTACNYWEGGVWNMNFIGMEDGSAPNGSWPSSPFTTIATTEEIQEKPFLAMNENGDYGVFVPEKRTNAKGTSWENGTAGEFISIDKFYIAKPGDSAAKINEQLSAGKNLILTPGIYEISEAIKVTKENTIVLGLGYATLTPTNGNQCITTADVDGIIIADMLIDAGTKESQTLMTVGSSDSSKSHKDNPITLANLYFRVGGANNQACKTKTCIIINSNNVICDNFWVWRADHGAGVAWDKNTCDTGVIVNGDYVTAYALMVEHFQKYQTIWNGEYGKTFMYQCEIPYDVPSMAQWMDGSNYGYAGYYVAPNVNNHNACGLGVYSNFTSASCFLEKAIIVPDKPGVKVTNAISVVLAGTGGIDHVVNNAGGGIITSGETCKLMSYCNGVANAETKNKKYITMTTVTGIKEKVTYKGKKVTFNNIKVSYRGVTLRVGKDYKVTYKNNSKIGTATVKIKGIGNFQSTIKYKVKIVPAKVNVTAKKGKGSITLKMTKVKGANRYQIVYSKNKKFKNKTVINTKKKKYKIKKLESKKNYYVKVRAYKVVNKKKVYGKYSKKIKIRTK